MGAVIAVLGRRLPRSASGSPDAAGTVPGFRGHGTGAADRHAQPGDDCRAEGARIAGRCDGGHATGVCALARPDRIPL